MAPFFRSSPLIHFFLLLGIVWQIDSRAEITYLGLDGEMHEISSDMSTRDFEQLISQIRKSMYQNSGEVGTRDSLAVQGGEELVSRYLNDLLREMAYYERLSYSPQLERWRDNEEWEKEKEAIRQSVNRATRPLGTGTNRAQVAAIVKSFDAENAKRAEQIDWYREALGEIFPRSNREIPRLSETDRETYRLTLKHLRDEDERERFKQRPLRDLLRAFDRIPSFVAECHQQLFKALPKAMSGHHPPPLSAALLAATKQKIQNEPDYAKLFPPRMLQPAAEGGTNQKFSNFQANCGYEAVAN